VTAALLASPAVALLLMPSASATATPLAASTAPSGWQMPWKSWLALLRPALEYCPVAICSGKAGPYRMVRLAPVRTCVAYSVRPVKARPPTRLPSTVGISFQSR